MASTAIRRIRRSSVARIGEHLCSSSSFGDWAGGTAPALAGWRQRRDASTAPAGAPATSFVACAIGEFSKFDPESQTVRYTPGSQEARSLLAQLQELAGQQEHFDTVSRAIADTLTLVHDASGMPHWATLAVCTVALRAALFPLTALSMRSMTVNAAILRTAGIVAAREGKSRWDLFRRARHNARAPGLWWPVVNAGVQLLALVELARTVRKMAFVGWPGFHNEGPLLFDGKLTSLLTPPINIGGPFQEYFGSLLPMGIEGTALPIATVLLATAYTSRTINRLYAEFFPEGPDGKPKVVHQLDTRELPKMENMEKFQLALPMIVSFASMTLNMLSIPLMYSLLTSPQAISYVVAPSLLMSLTVSELRTLPPVQHAILGKVFSEEIYGSKQRQSVTRPALDSAPVPPASTSASSPAKGPTAPASHAVLLLGGALGRVGHVAGPEAELLRRAASAVVQQANAAEEAWSLPEGPSRAEQEGALGAKQQATREELRGLLEGDKLTFEQRRLALLALGCSLLTLPRSLPDEAVEFMSRASRMSPDDKSAATCLSIALVAAGRKGEAEKVLRGQGLLAGRALQVQDASDGERGGAGAFK